MGFLTLPNVWTFFANDFLHYFRGIDSSDYIEAYKNINVEEALKILNENFDFEKMAVSIIENK